jgi:phage anti-repressor protein
MEKFEYSNKLSDFEIALALATHIKNPCQDGHGNNLREYYIREAERSLTILTNPDAKKLLEDTIQEYSKQ